ncbi:MAG TPA: carbonic anhydrase family protein [Myxococcaceae bacterium]|nr:carbonic anhydrase family protein [Myxococcaceae bacterium]
MRTIRTLAVVMLTAALPAAADEPKKSEGEKHWSYEHGITPPKWGEVAPTCASGTHQSPVALSTKQAKAKSPEQPLEIAWSKSTGELVDTGHSDQVNLQPGSSITYAGTKYELQQFHFHAPSEHTIDGKHAPMEAHFVHKSAEGKLAVVGILLKQGPAPSAFAPELNDLPAPGEKKSVEVDLPAMLPKSTRHFAYSGSLTTPPCSEDVQWIVMLGEDSVSKAEIAAFQSKYAHNARPVQATKGRTIAIEP